MKIYPKAKNPNLLINPDFAVNQRGLANYSSTYTVDIWKIGGAKLTVNDGYITLENTTEKATATIYQSIENPSALSGKTVTLLQISSKGVTETMSISQNFDYTPEETAEEKQARENRLKIAEYKHKLAATDYVALKIAEGAATPEEYAETLEKRAFWRSEINKLEE